MKRTWIVSGVGFILLVLVFIKIGGKSSGSDSLMPLAQTQEKILPKAQQTLAAVEKGDQRISVEELNQQVQDLDSLIQNSNMINKLNGQDLDDSTRQEFYQVIEARQMLLSEIVQRELAKFSKATGR